MFLVSLHYPEFKIWFFPLCSIAIFYELTLMNNKSWIEHCIIGIFFWNNTTIGRKMRFWDLGFVIEHFILGLHENLSFTLLNDFVIIEIHCHWKGRTRLCVSVQLPATRLCVHCAHTPTLDPLLYAVNKTSIQKKGWKFILCLFFNFISG